jgi:hypothetical protein
VNEKTKQMKTISKKQQEVRNYVMDSLMVETAMHFNMEVGDLWWYQDKSNTNLYYVLKRQKNEKGSYTVLCKKEFN